MIFKDMMTRIKRRITPRPLGKRGDASRWPWLTVAAGLWVGALVYLWLLAGFSERDLAYVLGSAKEYSHTLGALGAWLSGALYRICGMAAFWGVIWLSLAGLLIFKQQPLKSVGLSLGGAIWLTLASAALMGLTPIKLPQAKAMLGLGGAGGQAMAQGLIEVFGPYLAWLLPGLMAAFGFAVMIMAAWPVLGPFLEPQSFTKREADSKAETPPLPVEPAAVKPKEPITPAPDHMSMDHPQGPRLDEGMLNQTGARSEDPPVEPEELPTPPPAKKPVAPAEGGPLIRPRLNQPPPAEDAPEKTAGGAYHLPPLDLLQEPGSQRPVDHEQTLVRNSRLLEEKLADYGVKGQVREVAPGPVVTMYEFKPAPGVKISKVANLSDDLAMSLKAHSIRIVAPIPGKSVIGIEIPSTSREMVYLRELLASKLYQATENPLTIAVGKDILGSPVVQNLGSMPHVLIAGATGSGKSVFINTLVLSLLYKASPEQVRLLMVDPKRIELSTYNDIPHLLHPIITSPQEATAGLRWTVAEMERRYELLAAMGVRNIQGFNQKLKAGGWKPPADDPTAEKPEPLPYIVVIIDELSDLMMVSSKEVEGLITRLAQMARAAGIHLVLATQRPSVDVITGLIKANFPARISFQVTSRVDSRTILDQQGAEHLLGKGDMLFLPPGTAGVTRLHAAYVSDAEIEAVAGFVKDQGRPEYDESIVQTPAEGEAGAGPGGEDQDEQYPVAVALVRETGQASISYVQRRLRVGYNRAARMIEQMEREGIVGPSDGSRPREVLIRD